MFLFLASKQGRKDLKVNNSKYIDLNILNAMFLMDDSLTSVVEIISYLI